MYLMDNTLHLKMVCSHTKMTVSMLEDRIVTKQDIEAGVNDKVF